MWIRLVSVHFGHKTLSVAGWLYHTTLVSASQWMMPQGAYSLDYKQQQPSGSSHSDDYGRFVGITVCLLPELRDMIRIVPTKHTCTQKTTMDSIIVFVVVTSLFPSSKTVSDRYNSLSSTRTERHDTNSTYQAYVYTKDNDGQHYRFCSGYIIISL
jgi:hypothetical protein